MDIFNIDPINLFNNKKIKKYIYLSIILILIVFFIIIKNKESFTNNINQDVQILNNTISINKPDNVFFQNSEMDKINIKSTLSDIFKSIYNNIKSNHININNITTDNFNDNIIKINNDLNNINNSLNTNNNNISNFKNSIDNISNNINDIQNQINTNETNNNLLNNNISELNIKLNSLYNNINTSNNLLSDITKTKLKKLESDSYKLAQDTGNLVELAYKCVPSGTIIAYFYDRIPDGWVLCNGQNGTPNLMQKIIMNKSNTYPINSTGGLDNFKFTCNLFQCFQNNTRDPTWLDSPVSVDNFNFNSAQPFSILPPYIVLKYIMKT